MPAHSKSQQRLMGIAYAVKSGKMDLKDVDSKYADKVSELVDSMTLKQLWDFAQTPHDDLPEENSRILSFSEFVLEKSSNKIDTDSELSNTKVFNHGSNTVFRNYLIDKYQNLVDAKKKPVFLKVINTIVHCIDNHIKVEEDIIEKLSSLTEKPTKEIVKEIYKKF